MIELRNIHKSYGYGKSQHEVLKGIDLAFRENEFVAILGPSGSGKTTLLNVIGGLDHYNSGDLIIRDISTQGYSARDWDSYRNHSVGFIFQSYNLIQHQSILSNVEMALIISGVSGKQRRERAIEALNRVGLGDHILKKPGQLSGGQMQRVAIARALVNNPSVVLADEPTGALDSKTSVQVMELLKEIAQDRLVIMVTHNPELAQQYATRIITLKDGEIIGDTSPYRPEAKAEHAIVKNMGRTSMNLRTALSLSFHNLWTKRSRTFLTAFAGSIGIIGIALIASLSTGVDDYIINKEANMSYQYPLLVETLNMDIPSMLSELSGPYSTQDNDYVGVLGFLERLFSTLDTNDLERLKAYLEQEENDISQYGTVEYVYNVTPQIYVESGNTIKRVCPDSTLDALGLPVSSIDTSLISSSISTNMFYCMPQDESLYLDRYDVKAGRWPQNGSECILVLTADGRVTDYLLYVMGLRDPNKVDSYIKDFIRGANVAPERLEGLQFAYDDFLGVQFKVVSSCDYYAYDEAAQVWRDRSKDEIFLKSLVSQGSDLTIVGIVQPKAEYGQGVLKAGIDYPFALIEDTIAAAAANELVQTQQAAPEIDVFTGTPFQENDTAKDLDPASFIDVDIQTLKSAICVNQEKMERYFIEGADLSSIQVEVPKLNTSNLQFQIEISDSVRTQLAQDLPTMLAEFQLPVGQLSATIKSILADYMAFMEENGYLEIGELAELLSTYFHSNEFSTIIENWTTSLDMENADSVYLRNEIQVLSDTLIYSLNSYMEAEGVPQLPYLERSLREYLETERWKSFVQDDINRQLAEGHFSELMDNYIRTTIQPLVSNEISATAQNVKGQVASAANAATAQIQTAVERCILSGFSNTLAHADECISLDMEKFTEAFTLKIDM